MPTKPKLSKEEKKAKAQAAREFNHRRAIIGCEVWERSGVGEKSFPEWYVVNQAIDTAVRRTHHIGIGNEEWIRAALDAYRKSWPMAVEKIHRRVQKEMDERFGVILERIKSLEETRRAYGDIFSGLLKARIEELQLENHQRRTTDVAVARGKVRTPDGEPIREDHVGQDAEAEGRGLA